MKLVFALLVVLALVSARSYPLYKQCDSQWGSDTLGSGPDNVCKSGCLMSSVAMALNSYGKTVNGSSINPKSLNSWLKSNGGFSGDLFVWGSVAKLGMPFLGKFNAATAQSYLDQGKIVILNVRYGGHWVLATSRSGNTFYVNDPGYSVTSYTTDQVTQAAVFNISSGFLQQALENINNFLNN